MKYLLILLTFLNKLQLKLKKKSRKATKKKEQINKGGFQPPKVKSNPNLQNLAKKKSHKKKKKKL